MGVASGGLNWYLPILVEDLDLVSPEIPVDERRKLTRYTVSNPFFEFYYHFVAPNRAAIESGHADRVWRSIQQELESRLGRAFERVVREVLESVRGRILQGERFEYERLGPWWDRTGNEVDLVALGPKEIWAVEVEWSARPVYARGGGELLLKSPLLEARFQRGSRPLLVARNGCTEEARRCSRGITVFFSR